MHIAVPNRERIHRLKVLGKHHVQANPYDCRTVMSCAVFRVKEFKVVYEEKLHAQFGWYHGTVRPIAEDSPYFFVRSGKT